MNNLITTQSNLVVAQDEASYLYFKLGENKYALQIHQVVEIMKLPHLEYPQKLPNNIVGLLNYNNFTINVIDLRFYLDIKVPPYSVTNHLIIAKTDESFLGLIVDKPEDIFILDKSVSNNATYNNENNIIECIYKKDSEIISIINLDAVETYIKENKSFKDIDIPSLFPKDYTSKFILQKRNSALQEKNNSQISKNIFFQDRYVTFLLDNNVYCINLDYAKEFLKNTPITKIPCNLNYVEGVINLRGEFMTIVNLSEFINENIKVNKDKNNIIVLDFADYKVGIAVDEIYKIEDIPEEAMVQKSDENSDFILGEAIVGDKIYSILDIKNILADERFFIEQN